MDKKQFYELVDFIPEEELHPEVKEKLETIVSIFEAAKPSKS